MLSRHDDHKDLIRRICELAFGRANDAVKLAFLESAQVDAIDGLDLRMVSEIKRAANGAVEVKLISRIALLELLSDLTGESSHQAGQGAADFFQAMDAAAQSLQDTQV